MSEEPGFNVVRFRISLGESVKLAPALGGLKMKAARRGDWLQAAVQVCSSTCRTKKLPYDIGDTVGDRDAGQVGAERESMVPDAGDAGGDCDVGQAGAVIERSASDADDAGGDRNPGQAPAVTEPALPNAGDAGPNRNVGQAGAEVESPLPDAGDTVGDRDVGQVGAGTERFVPDAGDRQAVDGGGDAHRTARPVVTSDGEGAVVRGASELSLPHGGQRQQRQV